MQFFSIRDIENLSGIKAHTLRIWEQRYGLIVPARKSSRHRLYSNEDLKQILKISHLYHHGYKISKIAQLKPAEIDGLSLENSKDTHFGVFVNQFIEAVLDLDLDRFEQVFKNLLQHIGFEKAMIHVVYPYLEKLGRLWMTGNLLPAQEHFSSQFIRRQILLDTDKIRLQPVPNVETLVLFTPPGEFHEIPLLLIANFLRKNGFHIIYFGTNISMEVLAGYADVHPTHALYFHLLTNFTDLKTEEYVDMLRKRFPGRKILVSGPAAREISTPWPEVKLLHSIQEIRLMKPGFLRAPDHAGNT